MLSSAATLRRLAAATATALLACATQGEAQATEAHEAEPAVHWELAYTADVIGTVAGRGVHAGRFLDNIDAIADLDLERAAGWRGATLHAYLLNNSGGRPNDVAGTLQGIDNIEVSQARLRLYELWIEQGFADGHASLRAGLYDLNSEFYSTEASQLLLAPPFGIGSEFSATGPNGPSIFPLTSLAARLKVGAGEGLYAQAAVLGARAGGFSDPAHLRFGFGAGALLVGEAGVQGRTHLAVGGWTYTRRQDELFGLTPAGEPAKARTAGAYVLAERKVWTHAETGDVSLFLRAGASDGETTPFAGGWQAGFLAQGVTPGRPKSAVSLGLQQAFLNRPARRAAREAGREPAAAESGLDVTYADTFGRLSVQPDLQLVHRPGGDRSRNLAVIAGMRFTVALP